MGSLDLGRANLDLESGRVVLDDLEELAQVHVGGLPVSQLVGLAGGSGAALLLGRGNQLIETARDGFRAFGGLIHGPAPGQAHQE